MHQYLESLVQMSSQLKIEDEMLGQMFELYIDLVQIFVAAANLPDPRSGNVNNNVCLYIINSELYKSMQGALGHTGRQVKLDVQQRFQEISGVIQNVNNEFI